MRTLAGIGALAIAVGATVFFFGGYFSARVLTLTRAALPSHTLPADREG